MRSLFHCVAFVAVAGLAMLNSNSSSLLKVRGAVMVIARGGTEAGPTGTPEEPYYTITLGGPEGAAAAVFTRSGSATPTVGAYQVGERMLGTNGFSGLIITGMPSHPTGVFRVQNGTLHITAATPMQLAGRFELRALGFLTESPRDDDREVTATGGFTTRGAGRDTTLSLTRGSER
jgi:hypothetical protein